MSDGSVSKLFPEFPPQTRQEWRDRVEQDLKGADFEKKLVWKLEEGIALDPMYSMEDWQALPRLTGENLAVNKSSFAITPRQWETREYIRVGQAQDANRIALEALNQGATGLHFDLRDSGTVDLPTLLRSIEPNYCGISFSSKGPFALMKHYRQFLDQNDEIKPEHLVGQLYYDPLSVWMTTGFWDEKGMPQLKDVLELGEHLPNFRTLTVSSAPFQEAGASFGQELGGVIASVVSYLDAITDLHVDPALALANLALEVPVGGSFFPEIAKLRALRYLIYRVAEAYEVKDYDPADTFVAARSTLWNKTIFDPYVNMLRNTTEAMAGVMGGANSITVYPHDVAFRQPDSFSRRIARNISSLLQEEAHLNKVVDPAAGSYYLDHLTHEMAREGWAFFLSIEEHGGLKKAFEAGFIQSEIAQSEEAKERQLLKRSRKLVGVNEYPNAQEKIDPDGVELLVEKTVKTDLTLLRPQRAAAPFEELRMATERHVKRHGNNQRPRVLRAMVGDPVMRRARASFAASFFGVAGFEVLPEVAFDSWNEAAEKAAQSEASIVVLCGSDENYGEFGEAFAEQFVRKSSGKILVLAGCPQAFVNPLSEAGFEFFISAGTNAAEMLRTFQKRLSIIEG